MTRKTHLDAGQPAPFGHSASSTAGFDHHLLAGKAIYPCPTAQMRDPGHEADGNLANVG
jgi:hypothetical protein